MALNLFKKDVASFDPDNLTGTDRENSIKIPSYARGYSKYLEKHGGPDEFLRRKKEYYTGFGETSGAIPNLEGGMFDEPSNIFKKALYGYNNNTTDDYEDPTFLIFDIKLLKESSPLFTPIDYGLENFLDNYFDHIPEILERLEEGIYEEFLKVLFKIFPSESHSDDSGSKRHYIESISGLDVLNKKIINYPEDKITFTLSEDITLISHYLAELYNNLVFSYDTQRTLIPENLLRFNFQISVQDIRNFKTPRIEFDSEVNKTNKNVEINTNSKIIYTFHDCQFNFFDTKSITDVMTVNGWGTPIVSTPAKNSFSINFKSFSKAIAPYLIKDGKIIDFRERNGLPTNDFTISDPPINENRLISSKNSRFGEFISKKVSDTKKLIQNEASEIRATLINKLSNQVGGFLNDFQDALGEQLGLTITKVNVYYDSLKDKVDNASNFVSDFLDDKFENFNNNTDEFFAEFNKNKIHQTPTDIGNSRMDGYTFHRTSPKLPDGEVYEETEESPELLSLGEDLDGELTNEDTYHIKEPTGRNRYSKTILNDDGSFGEGLGGEGGNHYSSGYLTDVHVDGTYNEKYPTGKNRYSKTILNDDGSFEDDLTGGGGAFVSNDYLTDLHVDGTYNEKYPDGYLQDDGQYNLKLPDGDLHSDGTYHTKYPNGDLQGDSQYNLKLPDGDVQGDSVYNQKLPSGDVQVDGQYNTKLPDGDVQEDGVYNQKLPSGDVQVDGQYNTKLPDGNVYPDNIDNIKLPSGDVQEDGVYNQKLPSGDVQEDREYNKKLPTGNVIKPKDDIEESIDKKPTGSLYDNKKDDDKPPTGNVYNK